MKLLGVRFIEPSAYGEKDKENYDESDAAPN
jgi:hypothetical protein